MGITKTLSENKKALFNYQVVEKFRAGLVLKGQEVKSIRQGKMNLAGSFVVIREGEIFLIGASVPPYQPKNLREEYNPQRTRKLLLTKREIGHLVGLTQQKGLTLVPLSVYNDERNQIKLNFALVKGKREIDKREVIKKRETDREIRRVFKKL
ncbi:MAG: SsrA-binding protein SmpB [Candidatus Gribaldobacteria bacterium]|nr:SsrA-binding protein SmpB [Candidatus Gribaldobacteria bacterium]